ncbi:MAG: HAMP domain-containing histidine kinase [Gemmatimonadaceae bacterium]|nr:HAMP domain-containing histidine kinase [Gemmatimonadaceae bacterium]
MRSIRTKLTLRYTLVLLASMVTFAGAVYFARQAGVRREAAQQAVTHGDLAVAVLRATQRAGAPQIIVSDSLIGTVLNQEVARLLVEIPGYLIVIDDATERRVFTSRSVDDLYFRPGSLAQREIAQGDAEAFENAIASVQNSDRAVRVAMSIGEVVLVERRGTDPTFGQRRVIAGVMVSDYDSSAREILGSALMIFPFLLLLSAGGAYLIAGRAIRPIDRITTEVGDISDGRSLHRRLAIEASGDELTRLVTTLNAMIARLESSFGALRRFTADASHELKTPLAVMRADVERAMQSPPQSTEQLVALEEALQQTTRMADLVDSLLTLARADEGRFDLHREPVALGPLAREALETALILGEDAGLEVTMPTVEELTVNGDRTRLWQLFLNLITNAIKYTPRGGKVEINLLRHEDGHAHFSVKDTGIGISAADLPYIFERFWRADRVRSRSSERSGFGLGLAISQWIAQAHGGQLTVQSRLNRGSTFTVMLPIAGAPPPELEHGAEEGSATSRPPAPADSAVPSPVAGASISPSAATSPPAATHAASSQSASSHPAATSP